MKKLILLLMIMSGLNSFVAAQDTCVFYLTPDELVSKEVLLKSTNEMFDFNMMFSVKWLQLENKIQLVLDRKSVKGNDLFFLLLSMSKKDEPIKSAVDIKSQKKSLWSKLKSNDTKNTRYFLSSPNLKIENYANGFKLLPNNNEEEFVFDMNETEDFKIQLPGFLVVKTEKRPWWTLSKRDKKLQFITKPLDLVIQFEKKVVLDTCAMAEQVIPYIKEHMRILAEQSEDLLEAQKNKNCLYFNELKPIMRRYFVDANDKCERFAKACPEIAEVVQEYKNAFDAIYSEQCTAPARPASTCSLSESELSQFNNKLRTLQMKITVKKKDGINADNEFKDYRTIKTAVTSRLTPDCQKQYKNAIDAFINYCTTIESLQ
jgi:hypothetical protein